MSKRGKKCGVAQLSPEGARSATEGEQPFDIHMFVAGEVGLNVWEPLTFSGFYVRLGFPFVGSMIFSNVWQ